MTTMPGLMPANLWPRATVPYEIDPALDQAGIRDVLAEWEDGTPLTFVPRTPHMPDFLSFVPATDCTSDVGRQGGRQQVRLIPGCRRGIVLHEVGHALGLIHEHSRRDRDEYVTVRWENVDPRAERNFQRKASGLDLDELTYNYASIMHYSAMAFSMNRHITIHRTQPLMVGEPLMGQRKRVTEGDRRAVRLLYRDEAPPVPG